MSDGLGIILAGRAMEHRFEPGLGKETDVQTDETGDFLGETGMTLHRFSRGSASPEVPSVSQKSGLPCALVFKVRGLCSCSVVAEVLSHHVGKCE